jgi:hypothetical protein
LALFTNGLAQWHLEGRCLWNDWLFHQYPDKGDPRLQKTLQLHLSGDRVGKISLTISGSLRLDDRVDLRFEELLQSEDIKLDYEPHTKSIQSILGIRGEPISGKCSNSQMW